MLDVGGYEPKSIAHTNLAQAIADYVLRISKVFGRLRRISSPPLTGGMKIQPKSVK
jgi:hypothetical protein